MNSYSFREGQFCDIVLVGRSSVGRAVALQAKGRGFDPRRLHQFWRDMEVYQVKWGIMKPNPNIIASSYRSEYDEQARLFVSKEKAEAFQAEVGKAAATLGIQDKFFCALCIVVTDD